MKCGVKVVSCARIREGSFCCDRGMPAGERGEASRGGEGETHEDKVNDGQLSEGRVSELPRRVKVRKR